MLDFHFLSAYAVSFIPVQFGVAYSSALKADLGNAFKFTPPPETILGDVRAEIALLFLNHNLSRF